MTYRELTLRDLVVFQLKLAVDGIKDLVVFNVSILAAVVDVAAGRRREPRLFYSVLRASRRFDAWLDLHAALERIEERTG